MHKHKFRNYDSGFAESCIWNSEMVDRNMSPKGSQWNERIELEQRQWLQHRWLHVHFWLHTKDIILKRCNYEAYIKYERGGSHKAHILNVIARLLTISLQGVTHKCVSVTPTVCVRVHVG